MGTKFTAEALRKRQIAVHWLTDGSLARTLLGQRHRQSIFLISDGTVLNQVVNILAGTTRCSGSLVVLFCPRVEILPCLQRGMERVIYMHTAGAGTAEQTLEILSAPDRHERLIGVLPDAGTATVTFWSGDLRPLVVQAHWLDQRVHGVKFSAGSWRIVDGGRSAEIGSSRLSAAEIRCQCDVRFRREFRRREWATDESLGGQVRMLRRRLGLRREDFPGIDAKTVARIERHEIRRPQRETLRLIAQTLRLSNEHSFDEN